MKFKPIELEDKAIIESLLIAIIYATAIWHFPTCMLGATLITQHGQ